MKICRFEYNNAYHWGTIVDGSIVSLNREVKLPGLENHTEFPGSIEIKDVVIRIPVTPSKIICVGRNYAEHAAELGNEIPSEPLLFLKAPSSIITDGDAIVLPKQSQQVEHEGELAVIIGRECKDLPDEEQFSEYVFGYVCLNDVTARDLQRRDRQFTRAKSFDTFCPIGSVIETDLDCSDLRLRTSVNGVVKQEGRTSEMVFSIPFLIKYISHQMTLNAGDVIAAGTPSGVSKLSVGDICEVEIEGIGTLTNSVR